MLLPLLFAVFLHECGHILFLFLTGGKLKGVRVGILGITLNADYPPSYPAKILISLGGPIVGIVCFFLFHRAGGELSLFAEISLALSLFNLLPVSFLDGGNALEAFCLIFIPYERAIWITHTLSLVSAVMLWCFAVYLFLFLNGSASLFFLSLWFFFSLLFSKKS